MPVTWYDIQLTRHNKDVGERFTDAVDLDDPDRAKPVLMLVLRAAIVRHRGDLRDAGEYGLELRERGGSDVVMRFATYGEVQR